MKLFLLILFLSVSNAKADDLDQFAQKLFNHYQYDHKINKYLKSFFSFNDLNRNENFGVIKHSKNQDNKKKFKQKLKIKSKNKLIYSFQDGKYFQINPSNFNNEIIFKNTPFSYFKFNNNSLSYSFKIDY